MEHWHWLNLTKSFNVFWILYSHDGNLVRYTLKQQTWNSTYRNESKLSSSTWLVIYTAVSLKSVKSGALQFTREGKWTISTTIEALVSKIKWLVIVIAYKKWCYLQKLLFRMESDIFSHELAYNSSSTLIRLQNVLSFCIRIIFRMLCFLGAYTMSLKSCRNVFNLKVLSSGPG